MSFAYTSVCEIPVVYLGLPLMILIISATLALSRKCQGSRGGDIPRASLRSHAICCESNDFSSWRSGRITSAYLVRPSARASPTLLARWGYNLFYLAATSDTRRPLYDIYLQYLYVRARFYITCKGILFSEGDEVSPTATFIN